MTITKCTQHEAIYKIKQNNQSININHFFFLVLSITGELAIFVLELMIREGS